MIEKMSTFITGKMLLSGVICEDDKEIYVYGIDIMLSTLITCVLVFLLGLLTFGIHLSLFYLLTTAPLRRFGGGWHANTHYMCALVQCLVFLLVSIIAIAIVEHVSIWMLIIVQAVCYFVICVKAPAEHPDNPMDNTVRAKSKRNCVLTQCLIAVLSIILFATGSRFLGVFICFSAMSAIVTFLVPNREAKIN